MPTAGSLRQRNRDRLEHEAFDVLIIGGGINGAAAAAALAGKGAKVALIDRGDFAGSTSMQSSNLIWGGIKYLESNDFSLVRRLCKSRNRLLKSYPSTVGEIRFLTTIGTRFRYRPGYLYAGTWLYWLMGNGVTRTPRLFSARQIKRLEPVINAEGAAGGCEYSDAYLHDNDARFVFDFIRRALDNGAAAVNYIASEGAEYIDRGWVAQARDLTDNATFSLRANVMINAAGPWVDRHNTLTGQQTAYHHLYSKGVHLIVPQLTAARRVLAFFADDGRLFFVIPMGNRTCIGTTDTHIATPEAEITRDDVDFVLDNINQRLNLATPLTRADIIATRCGVRPLAVKAETDDQRDFLQLSRKHVIDIHTAQAHLSIFGGKLTDCLNVGDEVTRAVQALGVALPQAAARWYGEPAKRVKRALMRKAWRTGLDALTPACFTEPLSQRLWRRYADRAFELLERIEQDPRAAEPLIDGAEYLRGELDLACRDEMIVRLEDFLRRRTRISLMVPHAALRDSPGLWEACQRLFGERAQARFDEYFSRPPGIADQCERTRPTASSQP
ncbi:MAG: FAD-dependent oxidoreductase [Halomonas subglaciescola]|nr:FAD-dependent oxidoreductase [Halomonas subglaciescola]